VAIGTVLLATLALSAGAARAAPVNVFFDGALLDDLDGSLSRFGVSSQQAILLRDVHGVTIRNDLAVDLFPPLQVRNGSKTFLSADPDPPIDPDATPDPDDVNTAQWVWTIETTSALLLDQWVLFTHSDPFEKDGVPVDYPDVDIGLTMDPDDGWVLVQSVGLTGESFFFPAFPLSREDLESSDGAALPVPVVLKHAYVEVGGKYQPPEYQLGRAYAPEPSTLLLLGSALLFMAARPPGR